MDTNKKTLEKGGKISLPVKKLIIDLSDLRYRIEGESLDVNVFLDVGVRFTDKENKSHQVPELKISVERNYKNQANMPVEQVMELMRAGYRPTKKWASSFVLEKTGKTYIPNDFSEAVDIVEKCFNENHTEVFGFKIDLSLLKTSNIADIFKRACNGQTPIERIRIW